MGLQVLLPAESVTNVQIPCAAEHVGSGPDYLTMKTPLMTLLQIGRRHLEATHGKPTPSSDAGGPVMSGHRELTINIISSLDKRLECILIQNNRLPCVPEIQLRNAHLPSRELLGGFNDFMHITCLDQ